MRLDGRAGVVSRKGFLFPKKEEREGGRGKKEARRKEGRKEGREGGRKGLSSAGHSYLDVVLGPPCYQGKSKAER